MQVTLLIDIANIVHNLVKFRKDGEEESLGLDSPIDAQP